MYTFIENLVWYHWVRKVTRRPQVLVMDSKNWKQMIHEMYQLLPDDKATAAVAIVARHQHLEAK